MSDIIKSPAPFEMTLTFRHDAAEHVRVMAEASRRFYAVPHSTRLLLFAISIAAGLLVGLVMEFNRRYLLPAALGRDPFPDFASAFFYFLPVFVVTAAAVNLVAFLRRRAGLKNLARRFAHRTDIGMDISAAGIRVTSDDADMFFPWTSFRAIALSNGRIECDSAGFCVYIPERAFAGKDEFKAGYKRIHSLWRQGVEAELARRNRPG